MSKTVTSRTRTKTRDAAALPNPLFDPVGHAAADLLDAAGAFPEALRKLCDVARRAGYTVDGSLTFRRYGYGPVLPASPNASGKHLRLHRLAERDGGWQCWHCIVELVDYCTAPTVTIRTDGTRCISAGIGRDFATEDHLIPRQFRGGDDLDNLVLSCSPCNSRRGAA